MRLLICVLFVVTLASCSSHTPPPPGQVALERKALDRLRDEYVAAFNAADADRVAGIYAADATVMPPNEPPLNGRTAIRDWFKAGFDQFTMKASLSSQEFALMGTEWAFDRGTYTLTLTPKAGGNSMQEEYKYLTLLHKERDGWKAKRDIYNSSKPTP